MQPMPTEVLRERQEADPQLGSFFQALHAFADRTIKQFFHDTPELPHPVIALERTRATCRGEYQPVDGALLPHKIIIDPHKCATGEDAAEVLAHELVHLWQHYVGKLPERNYHNAEFHNRLGLLGILSSGKAGHHNGYIEGGVWQEWLAENDDLQLAKFALPNDGDEGRKLLKYQCPACQFSFRTRRDDVFVQCSTDHAPVDMERAS